MTSPDRSGASRLELLHGLRAYLVRELARVEAWIAAEERFAAQRAEHAARRPLSRRPEWLFEYGIGGAAHAPVSVHTGQCWEPSSWKLRAVSRVQALEALTRGGVPGCPVCRPEIDLGVLE